MKLSTFLQESAKFQTKGRWYSSDQVDKFIDKMLEGIDKLELDNESLRRQIVDQCALVKELEALKEENARLRDLSQTKREDSSHSASGGTIAHMRKVCEELEKERDELIDGIKLLRRFREEFRTSVKQDAEDMIKRIEQMESDELL